ncbi:MAG: hypothetical protein R6U61_07250 [Thermoplasmata archaeon]
MLKKTTRLGVIFSAIALLLLVITFFTPWYTIKYEAEGEGYGYDMDITSEIDAYFGHYEAETTSDGETDYDEEDYDDAEHFGAVFSITRVFVIIAIITTVIGLAASMMVLNNGSKKKTAVLILAVAVLFSFLAPIYMMNALPDALGEDMDDANSDIGAFDYDNKIDDDFFGSDDEERNVAGYSMETHVQWGGSTAWFAALFAFVLNVVGFMMVLIHRPDGHPLQSPGQMQSRHTQQNYQQPYGEEKQHYSQDRGWEETKEQDDMIYD